MAKQRRSLSGKVVAITGGARGIGKATAKALIAKGCRVAIGDLQLELAEKTAAELGGAAHSPAEHLLVDSLEDRAAVALAVAVAVLGP